MSMFNLKKSAVAVAIAFGAVASAQAATTTITNGTLTAAINDGGNFAVSPLDPLGTPGLSWMGVEFVNIDNPAAWWTLESTSGPTLTAKYNSNPVGSTTSGGGPVATTFDLPTLSFFQTAVLTSANQISFSVSFHNTGLAAMTGVTYGVGFDPDQGGSGNNTTTNQIVAQGPGAAVVAKDLLYGTDTQVTLANTTGAFPGGVRSFINSGSCCATVSPTSVLSGALQAPGFSTVADDSISLAYDIGTIAPGATVTLGYSYTFAAAVPEPETYAMLLAGLGLMGFVARRRQRNAAA